MSPRFVARLVDGKYKAIEIRFKRSCPYCHFEELELEVSFESIISGVHVDWYVCRRCGVPVEVIDDVTSPIDVT